MGGKVDGIKLLIEKMRKEKGEDGRTLGEVARESAQDMREDSPAAAVVNTALAINWKWTLAEPRIERFKVQYPKVKSFSSLKQLLGSMNERDFCRKVLDIPGAKPGNPRRRMLKDLVEAFLDYERRKGLKDDWEAIQKWGEEVNVDDLANDPVVGGIKGVGPATVQNIKIVSGFDTSKPDRRLENALRHLRLRNPVHIVELLSELTGYKCIELDQLFWYWDDKRQKK